MANGYCRFAAISRLSRGDLDEGGDIKDGDRAVAVDIALDVFLLGAANGADRIVFEFIPYIRAACVRVLGIYRAKTKNPYGSYFVVTSSPL